MRLSVRDAPRHCRWLYVRENELLLSQCLDEGRKASPFGKNCPLRLWTGNDDEPPSSLSLPDAPSASPDYLDLSGRPVSIGDSPTTLASTSKGVGLKHAKS